MNISFRMLTESELDIADMLLVAAYGFSGSRKALVHNYLTLQPDGWWIASVDGVPTGYGGAIIYGPFSYIGMLSVLPSWQRQGVGRALMEHIMAWVSTRGCSTMLLECRKALVSFYTSLGFVQDGETIQMTQNTIIPQSCSFPESISLLQPDTLSEIVDFDALYFGGKRPTVLRAQTNAYPDRTFVAHNSAGNMTGYLIAESRSLGPWVAKTVEVAEQLLVSALTLPYNNRLSLTIPASNSKGIQLLARYGFSQDGARSHMRYGLPASYRRREMIYAQTSPALG